MKYGLIEKLELKHSECLVLGVFSDIIPSDPIHLLHEKKTMLITQLMKQLKSERDIAWQTAFDDTQLLLIHCGERESFNSTRLQKILDDITQELIKQRITSTTLSIPQVIDQDANAQLENIILKFSHAYYQLLDFKQDKKKQHQLKSISIHQPNATEEAIKTGSAIADGIVTTRTLANLPSNVCTPTYLADMAIKLAKKNTSIKTTILNEDDLKTLGMGALLAVAKGSHESPKLIEMHYHGAAKKVQPIVLVGKGITFDSGGISLKPPSGMEEMKYDMAGAASVLGALQACADLKLPINVIGLMACAENMPGGGATKPGDIITTFSGQTVEIINTDAEGRLVLADALTYAEQFNPRFVLDMATLTGAIIIALGHENTGLMTEDNQLADLIIKASEKSQDNVWRMPLQAAYQEAIDSQLADMVNSTFDRSAGSVTAACFLSRFTKKYPWAHLDIAGTAWVSGRKNQATGRPVPLLVEILRHVASSS
jgi:leucyl aminopeptidase